MKSYYRVMLGRGSKHATACLLGNFIGADFDIREDLTPHLSENWKDFNRHYIPIYLNLNPDKGKISAGLSCGALWTVSKGIVKGDIVLCPDGTGVYQAAEVVGDYQYVPDGPLCHRRAVRWFNAKINRDAMSDALRRSCGSIGTVSTISQYRDEIEKLLSGQAVPILVVNDETIEDPIVFAMEKHLEEFLVKNWKQTELGKDYDIYVEDGELGQQFSTDTGPIDILAISKDKKTLLVVELKRGRVSDVVVGQTLRYMGYVQEELAEEGQQVRGAIVALEDSLKLRRSLATLKSISFYRYKVDFKLEKS